MDMNTKIYNAIHASVKNNQTTWADISASVNNANLNIKNWLKVRGVLQFCINNGEFKRTNDTTKEIYTFIKRTINN